MIATEKLCIKNTPKSQAHICGVFLLFSAIHLVFSPIITLRVCDIRSASVWRPDGCFVQRLSPEPRRSTFRCVFRLHAAVLAQSSLKALATHLFVAKKRAQRFSDKKPRSITPTYLVHRQIILYTIRGFCRRHFHSGAENILYSRKMPTTKMHNPNADAVGIPKVLRDRGSAIKVIGRSWIRCFVVST